MNVLTFKSNLFKRVGESGRELSVATELLDELEVVGAMLPLLVDVRDAAQQGIEDDLRVVLEEVDLKRKKDGYQNRKLLLKGTKSGFYGKNPNPEREQVTLGLIGDEWPPKFGK